MAVRDFFFFESVRLTGFTLPSAAVSAPGGVILLAIESTNAASATDSDTTEEPGRRLCHATTQVIRMKTAIRAMTPLRSPEVKYFDM